MPQKDYPPARGQKLTIRTAEPGDAAELLDFLEEVSGQTDYLTHGPGELGLSEEAERKFIEETRRTAGRLFIVACLEGRIVATLGFRAGDRVRVAHCGEFGMAVRRECWGQGIGSRLVDYLLEWARGGGQIRKINLQVRVDNERAISLYLKKGFSIEGRNRCGLQVGETCFDFYYMGIVL